MLRTVMYGISWLVIGYSLVLGSVPVFMMGFVLAALAGGGNPSPILSMAVVKGMNFTRGRLGNVGFRQQYVKERGGYKRRTVAFQLPDTVANPRTSGQVRQRTKFKLIQAIGSALSAKGITYNFYRSGRGISGYNAFIRDGILQAIVEMPDGMPYVDWNKLQVTKGDFAKKITPYMPMSLKSDDCNCARLLAWNYDWTCDPDGNAYALNLIGVKVDQEGAIEDIVCVQPRVPMSACQAEVLLPKCDCCKTYWYAYFVDPYTGYFSNSAYVGTCDCKLPAFDPSSCVTCTTPEPMPSFAPPSECPTTVCGDGGLSKGAREKIVYQGISNVPNGYLQNSNLIYPACPMLEVAGVVDKNETYQTSNVSEGLTQLVDNNGLVVTEWEATGNGDADWSEGGVAWEAVIAMGYYPMVDLEGGTIDISGTNGRVLKKLVLHAGTAEENEFIFGLVPNTEVLNFLVSPLASIDDMSVVDTFGNTVFDGNPSTLDGGILSITPGAFPAGIGSLIYTFTLTPMDTICPNTVVQFEFDGDSLFVLDSTENKQANPIVFIDVTDAGPGRVKLAAASAPKTLVKDALVELFDAGEQSLGTARISATITEGADMMVEYSPSVETKVDKIAVLETAMEKRK